VFDAVFIHDAVNYMTTEHDLGRAIETAWVHCRPGGAALFCPDDLRETFRSRTSHGGHDRMLKSMRYLEWMYDPDPDDTTVVTDFAYLLRDRDGVRVEYDRHVSGFLPRATWLRLLSGQGFEVTTVRYEPGEPDAVACEVFICAKPG